MREMKDSGISWIGLIPKGWNIYRNKNAFSCSKELVGKKFKETQLLSLTTKGIKLKDINNPEGKLPESFDTYQYVKKDEIVMCLFDLDCSAVFSGLSPYDGMISPAYKVLTCTTKMVPAYADYWFTYISYDRKFNHYAKNIRYTLNYEEFASLPMLFPSVEEQHRIADYLDKKCAKIDAIIEKQQEIIEKLKEYKLSVITEAVTKGLNTDVKIKDSGIDWIEYIPATWEVAKLNKCLSTYKGYAFKSDKFSGSGIPVVRVSEIKNGTVLAAEMHIIEMEPEYKNVVLNSGDILMTTVGSNPKVLNSAVGQLARLPEELNGALLNQNAVCLRAKEGINTDFLYYFLTIKRYREHLNLIAHGTANQYSISLAELLDFYMLIPPYEEQCAIADSLNAKTLDIDKTIIDREEAISKLYNYKKSLIFEAVTGKKEV